MSEGVLRVLEGIGDLVESGIVCETEVSTEEVY
jgi:hypothetical protein